MDAMPGYYEHEEPIHNILMDGESEDDQVEEVVTQKLPKERIRPATSAIPRSSSMKLEDSSSEIRSEPKPLGRNRSKSDVGHQSDQPRYDISPERKAQMSQMCPICGRLLMADNQGLNAHIDFCLSRNAIREARDESVGSSAGRQGKVSTTVNLSSSTPVGRGWEFLMGKKDTLTTSQMKKSKKRR